MPDDMPELTVAASDGAILLTNLLREAGLVASTSEAMRMIDQGAVRIDGERVADKKLAIASDSCQVYQVGKRKFARITLI
jgi:tyrosyl-tRNA synthetase